MGYYTWYTLEVLKDPDDQEDQFWEELDEITGFANDFKKFDGAEAKWYSWKEDMIKLSKKFPKMFFSLDGNGEGSLDIWVAHFCNGECNYREIQTYWEKFDSEEFYNTHKS